MGRLYRLLIGVLLACSFSWAFAVITPAVTYRGGGITGTVGEIVAAQQAKEVPRGCDFGKSSYTYSISARNVTPQSFEVYGSGVCPTNGVDYSGVLFSATAVGQSCPFGSALTGGSCVCIPPLVETGGAECKLPACPVGQHEEGGACVPDACKPTEVRVNGVCVPDPDLCEDGSRKVNGKCPTKCPKAGTSAGEFSSGRVGYSFCENRCVVTIEAELTAVKDGVRSYIASIGMYTGASCDGPSSPPPPADPNNPTPPSPNPPASGPSNPSPPGGGGSTGGGGGGGGGNNPPPPDKCPAGGCSGTDGNPPGGTPPDSTGTCAAGTYKSGNSCYPKDPPPKPPDNDGKCPAGYVKVGSTCVQVQPKPDDDVNKDKEFCKQNPNISICRTSSFTGSCGSFNCDGDAIQCAIAREQYQTNCKLYGEDRDTNSFFNRAVAGTDGFSVDKLKSEAAQVTVSTFDQSGFGWSTSCPADPSIPLGFTSHEITIPFSRICGPLGILSLAGVGITLLGCLVWVLGGKRNGA